MNKIMLLMLCCMHMLLQGEQPLSFDLLFPLLWYEKGLQSTMNCMHKVDVLMHETMSQVDQTVYFDSAIGNLAFAHFCIMRIQYVVVQEDIVYFSSLLDHLDLLLGKILTYSHNHDQVACLKNILHTMQHDLHIPSNV